MKQMRKTSELMAWSKNPRAIMKEDFARLKEQIKRLGQYKPLLITKDGVVLGGNMRLRAYQELGIKEVWVSEVEADTEEKKIEYALSDNDRAGFYDEVMLTELIAGAPNIDLDLFKIDIGKQIKISDLSDFKGEFLGDEDIEEGLDIKDGEVAIILKMDRDTYDAVKDMVDSIVSSHKIECRIKS